MLRTRCNLTLRTISSRQPVQAAAFSSSYSHSIPYQPNAPLDLDPAFQSLLKDVEMAMTQKARAHHPVMEKPPRQVRELEEFPADAPSNMKSSAWELEETETRDSRKSPAALFGSRKIGAVILPKELQSSVGRLIEGAFCNSFSSYFILRLAKTLINPCFTWMLKDCFPMGMVKMVDGTQHMT